MDRITILDTSIGTDNLGDEIIMQAVQDVIREVLPNAYAYRVATHEYMSHVSHRLLRTSDLCIVGGTNLLSAHMGRGGLWRLMPWDLASLRNVMLLGVGWRGYMEGPNAYTRWMLRHILSNGYTHSVRDRYTQDKLSGLNKKVVNTACPTMWRLDESHCRTVPRRKAQSAIATLTYYNPSPENDRALLTTLKQHYKHVYFWPQQYDDDIYLHSLGVDGIRTIAPNLCAFDEVLEGEDCDFVGTRLHGGIRALQKRRRTLIIGIDNRATEIAKNFMLPVLDRECIADTRDWIYAEQATVLTLPLAAIDAWKAQFLSPATDFMPARQMAGSMSAALQSGLSDG